MRFEPPSLGCRAGDERTRWTGGFTLVEMLVVVTVATILLTVVTMSLRGTMQASTLTSAGNQVTQLFEQARQRAMSGNVLTAVVLLTNQSVATGASNVNPLQSVDGRALTMIEYSPDTQNWKQATEWMLLPDGIAVDVSGSVNSFFSNYPSPFPFMKNKGAPVAYLKSGSPLNEGGFAARVFLPAGGLLDPADPAQFQLVLGNVVKGKTQYTEKNGPVNYYRISLIGATGRTKVERPTL